MSSGNGFKTTEQRMSLMNDRIVEAMKEADDIRWQCPKCKAMNVGRIDAWKSGCPECGWKYETGS